MDAYDNGHHDLTRRKSNGRKPGIGRDGSDIRCKAIHVLHED